jgi:hypothetical protein
MTARRPAQVGDVVRWHPDAGMNVDWVVTEVHPNGRLTIETDIHKGDQTRTIRRSAYRRDVQLVGEQLGFLGFDESLPDRKVW